LVLVLSLVRELEQMLELVLVLVLALALQSTPPCFVHVSNDVAVSDVQRSSLPTQRFCFKTIVTALHPRTIVRTLTGHTVPQATVCGRLQASRRRRHRREHLLLVESTRDVTPPHALVLAAWLDRLLGTRRTMGVNNWTQGTAHCARLAPGDTVVRVVEALLARCLRRLPARVTARALDGSALCLRANSLWRGAPKAMDRARALAPVRVPEPLLE